MTKSQAMDAAIAAGADLPADAVAYVKSQFGMDISNKQFSTHKSLVRKKATIDSRGTSAARPTAAVTKTPTKPSPSDPTATPVAKGPASPAELARQVKALVAAHGAEAVGEMVDVFRE